LGSAGMCSPVTASLVFPHPAGVSWSGRELRKRFPFGSNTLFIAFKTPRFNAEAELKTMRKQ
jgi:hypothetical protein